MSDPSLADTTTRADLYASIGRIRRERKLGDGQDGIVFQTSAATAIKIFNRPETFERERDCYIRLAEMSVRKIMGFTVPQLINVDERFLVVEMSIVQPPFLLDFASAYLDNPPEFSEDVLEEWQNQKQFQFGEKWGTVQILLEVLKNAYGIHFLDATPNNIRFSDDLQNPSE